MTLSIIIPPDSLFHKHFSQNEAEYDKHKDSVWHNFCDQLKSCETRDVLFYDEEFTGYIIYETESSQKTLPKCVFLDQVSRFDQASGISIQNSLEQAKGAGLDSKKIRKNKPYSKESPIKAKQAPIRVTDLLWQGQYGYAHDVPLNVSIWRFVSSIRCPQRETSGYAELKVFLENPSFSEDSPLAAMASQKRGEEMHENTENTENTEIPSRSAMNFGHTENLLEELNYGVLNANDSKKYVLFYSGEKDKNGAHSPHQRQSAETSMEQEKEHKKDVNNARNTQNTQDCGGSDHKNIPGDQFTLRVQISAPLQLKLRTTKPGGRNDVFFTTLQIEAPEPFLAGLPAAKSGNNVRYAYHILGLDASFKGGRISPLGQCDFPRRYEINDCLNVAFRLDIEQHNEKNTESGLGLGVAMSKPVNISLRVQLEKTDNCGNFSSKEPNWTCITREISTVWAPILDFDSGYLAPVFPLRSRTPQMSQSQFRSKSTHLKLPPSTTTGAGGKKSVSIKNSASSSALSAGANTLSSPFSPYPHRHAWPSSVSPNPLRPISSNQSSPSLSISRSAASKKRTPKFVLSKPGPGGPTSGLTVNLSGDTGSVLSGLKLTFSGNPQVELGKVTTWEVKAVNQTSRALKLSLMTNSAKRNNPTYSHPYQASSAALSTSHSTLQSVDGRKPRKGPGVQNRLQLYEQYNLAKTEKTGIVLLSNDVSLGVLEPNQVFESEFQFVAFSKGIFSLAGLRVVDSSTGETADVGRLLEVYVS